MQLRHPAHARKNIEKYRKLLAYFGWSLGHNSWLKLLNWPKCSPMGKPHIQGPISRKSPILFCCFYVMNIGIAMEVNTWITWSEPDPNCNFESKALIWYNLGLSWSLNIDPLSDSDDKIWFPIYVHTST